VAKAGVINLVRQGALALLLASSASSFMTGGVYPADGGQLLQSLPLPPP
jgi:hypothetical protein